MHIARCESELRAPQTPGSCASYCWGGSGEGQGAGDRKHAHSTVAVLTGACQHTGATKAVLLHPQTAGLMLVRQQPVAPAAGDPKLWPKAACVPTHLCSASIHVGRAGFCPLLGRTMAVSSTRLMDLMPGGGKCNRGSCAAAHRGPVSHGGCSTVCHSSRAAHAQPYDAISPLHRSEQCCSCTPEACSTLARSTPCCLPGCSD